MNFLKRADRFLGFLSLTFVNFSCLASDIWQVVGNFGYASNSAFYNAKKYNEKSAFTYFLRSAVGHEAYSNGRLNMGWELGLQTGQLMRFPPPDSAENKTTTLLFTTPSVDLLGTLEFSIRNSALIAQIKGGIASRFLYTLTENTINEQEFTPEIQVGIGYWINGCSKLCLMYQAMFWGKSKTIRHALQSSSITQIPMQQSIMLAITTSVFFIP